MWHSSKQNAFVRRGLLRSRLITSNSPPPHLRGRLLPRCDGTSEAAGCRVQPPPLQTGLTSLAVKPERVRRQAGTIRGPQTKSVWFWCNSSHVWVSCISLYPEHCGEKKNDRGRKKLDKNLNHLSTNAGEFGNRRRREKKNIPKQNGDSAVLFLNLPKTNAYLRVYSFLSAFCVWRNTWLSEGGKKSDMNQAEENVF